MYDFEFYNIHPLVVTVNLHLPPLQFCLHSACTDCSSIFPTSPSHMRSCTGVCGVLLSVSFCQNNFICKCSLQLSHWSDSRFLVSDLS